MNSKYRSLVVASCVAVVAYSATWLYFSRQFESHIESELAKIQAKGFDVSFDYLKIAGFPFGYDVRVENLEIRRGKDLKTWIDDDITFSTKLWSPGKITSVAGGTHHLSFDNVTTQGEGFTLRSMQLDPLRFQFYYDDLTVKVSGDVLLTATELEYDVDLTPEDGSKTTGVKVRFEGLESPLIQDNILGAKIEHAEIEAVLRGVIRGETNIERLQNWFEDNGVIDIEGFSLKWGQLVIKGEGTVSLDEQLQPLAAFSTTIENLDHLVDSLVEAKSIDKKMASFLKAGIDLFATDDSKISFTIQDGKLLWGSHALARFPKIEWK